MTHRQQSHPGSDRGLRPHGRRHVDLQRVSSALCSG
ncbi:putative leader peptide [Nakamurella alba]